MSTEVKRADLDGLLTTLKRLFPAYLRDLEHLVSIESSSRVKSGVDEVSGWMASRLADLGATIAIHPSGATGDIVTATLTGDPHRPTVVVIGHADTVFEPGTVAQRPFTIRGERALGPGVADMKGGLLTGLYALDALRQRAVGSGPWLPVGRLVFIIGPDEELGSPVSTPVIRGCASEADAVLVLESARPNGDLVSARSGMTHLRICVRGRAAHAGIEPEKGRSAILEAAHQVVSLHGLNGRWEGVHVNVGEVRGGTRPNMVPDEAVMSVDVRAQRAAEQGQATAAIEAITSSSTVPDVTTSVEILAHHQPMEHSAASLRLVRSAVEVAADLGFELDHCATGGSSDANTTAAMGVPSLDGLGPVGGGAHSAAEYLRLDSIVPRTTLLAGLLLSIGRERAYRA
jgi:glutamate carboxypeptidase